MKIYFVWWMILSAHAIMGQSVISGVVYDENRQAIPKVMIIESKFGEAYHTDNNGRFSLELPHRAGTVELLFISDQHHLLKHEKDLEQDSDLEITLKKLSVQLSEVVISERRKYIYGFRNLRDKEGTVLYAGKKTEVVLIDNKVSNLAVGTPRQVYNQVTGINAFEADDGGLQLNIGVRGLNPNRSSNLNTRQNGYDISADVLGYPESYYTPPTESLSEIQVIKGAASLQYGTQFGGLVNFKLKEVTTDRPLSVSTNQTYGSFGLFTSFNRISGKYKRLTYSGFYNYKRGDGFRPNAGFHSNNVFGKISYDFGSGITASAEVTKMDYMAQQPGGLTDAQFYLDPTFSNRERNYFEVDWLLYNFKINHKINPGLEYSISLSGLDAERAALGFRTNRVSQSDDPAEPRELLIGNFNNYNIEARVVKDLNLRAGKNYFLLGAKYYNASNASYQGPGQTGTAPDFSRVENTSFPFSSNFEFPNKNLAVFSEIILPLTEKLTFTPGARYEYIWTRSIGTFTRTDFDLAGNVINSANFDDNQSLERNFFLFGLGATYKMGNNRELYFNISENYRSVTFSDLRIINPSFQIDENIRDESGYTFDLGYRGNYARKLTFDISVFGLGYNNRIGEVLKAEERVSSEGEKTKTGRIVRFRSNLGKAFIYGLEGNFEYRFVESISSPYRFSIFNNLAVTGSTYLESEIPNVEGNQVEFSPRINVKSGVNFGYKNFRGSLQYTYLSSQFTDATNAPQDIRDNQRGIEGVIPGYGVWDFSVSQRMNAFRISFGINNLLDNIYFSRRATGYPGPGIIPSAPRAFYLSLGYEW